MRYVEKPRHEADPSILPKIVDVASPYLRFDILITHGMIGFSVHSHRIFQMPFFSIVIEEVLEWIIADAASLEQRRTVRRSDNVQRLASQTHIIIRVFIARSWTGDDLRRRERRSFVGLFRRAILSQHHLIVLQFLVEILLVRRPVLQRRIPVSACLEQSSR